MKAQESVLSNADSWSGRVIDFAKSTILLVRSEIRVTIFVWALTVSYLVASNLRPSYHTLGLLIPSGYFLVFGIYVLNDLVDLDVDKINSPNRPLAAGNVKKTNAEILIIVSIAIAFSLVLLINAATLGLFVLFLILGLSYSIPRVNVKKRFPLKAVVPAAGAGVISLAGGLAAQGLRPVIFFAAVAFALFALVTLLIGDIADLNGDAQSGVRSFPLVVGPKNSARFVMMIPILICGLGVFFFSILNLNVIFPLVLIGLSAYCCLTIRPLLANYDDPLVCRRIKSRMRIVHFLIQLTFILGLLAL